MTTTHRPVSKTRVNLLTREVRREADKVRNMVDALDLIVKFNQTSIPEELALRPKAQDMIRESLNVIDGNSALLRAALLGEEI